jgi:hypothetical protein
VGGAGSKMIYLAICRIGVCEICAGRMILPEGDYIPERCEHCQSSEWLYGVEPQDGIRVRTGQTHVERVLNPGVKSKKRQDRARAQYQHLKPKAVDDQATSTDN